MPESNRQIKVLNDTRAVAVDAAERFVSVAREAISARGAFAVGLAGGSTPKAMYELLAAEPHRSAVEWGKVEIYFGDERCVPPDHPDSNYRMASETLLSRVPIPPANVHRMRGEEVPLAAAIEYGQMLKSRFGDGGLDLIYLGMGDDGHTASLFPGTEALGESHHRCLANWVEKLRAWRITLSAPFINRAHEVIVLVTGSAKAKRLHEVLDGERDPSRLPVQLIEPADGRLTWLVDAPAAGMI